MLALFVSSALLSLTVEPCVLRTGIRTIWRTECDKKMAALDILHRPLLRSDCWVAKTDLIGLVHITDKRLMQCVSLCFTPQIFSSFDFQKYFPTFEAAELELFAA